MIHLTGFPAGRPASRETLASMAEVPPQFLGKVLQSLTRADLIRSRRGAQGGFELARPSIEINMLQILEAIEGPLCLNTCLSGAGQCTRSWWCSAHPVWRQAQEAMAGVLASATLDKLAFEAQRRIAAGPPSGSVMGGASWS
jgi:Rrf2 family protein